VAVGVAHGVAQPRQGTAARQRRLLINTLG